MSTSTRATASSRTTSVNGVACEEFTIESEETTWLVNYADDSIRGTLDVCVTDDAGEPITDDDILVLLFDQENNLVAWECLNASLRQRCCRAGLRSSLVPNGNYTVTATDSAAEFQFWLLLRRLW